MAEEAKQQEKKPQGKENLAEQNDKQPSEGKKSPSGFGLFTWIILGTIVLAGFTGGFALAQLLAGTKTVTTGTAAANADSGVKTFEQLAADKAQDEKPWSYELESVVANLDEPGVTRYARVTLTLEISPAMDTEKGRAFLDGKKPVLRDWLTTYVAGLTLERARGTGNLARIKKEIKEQYNELLFSESQPFITDILFKDFVIQ